MFEWAEAGEGEARLEAAPPEGRKVRLGEVCEERRGRIPTDGIDCEHYVTTDNMVKNLGGVVRAKDVPSGASLVQFCAGDILMSNIRPYLKKVWLADRNGGCSNDVIVLAPQRNKVLPEYLRLALSQEAFFAHVMRDVSGTKMPRGKRGWILEFLFALPELEKQRAIVERVEKRLERVERMEKGVREMGQWAERQGRAVLGEAFGEVGGREDGEGNWGRAARAPTGGRWVNVEEVCEVLDSMRRPITQKDRVPGPIPYYGATGVVDHVQDYIFNEPLVLLGEDGAKWGKDEVSAYLIDGKAWVNNHAHVLRTKPCLSREFLVHYLNHADLSAYISGVTVPKLTQGRMREIPIPLPPLEDQRAIVERLERELGRVERVKKLAKEGVEWCGKLRRGVLAEAFG